MIAAASRWREELQALSLPEDLALMEGKGGALTLRAKNVLLHSKYNPEQEAQRLIDAAALNPDRPVLVIGLALGYHIRILLKQGFEILVIEENQGVAKCALESLLQEADFQLGIGEAQALSKEADFQRFMARLPQVLVHPPTARLCPDFVAAMSSSASTDALEHQHLRIAVVGPLYGGSLPITDYLVNAFEKLGHRTLKVDNATAWPLYDSMTASLENTHAANQLGSMLSNLLSEWTYARVAEFNPEICIVLAQAPVSPVFPERLRKLGIVTAFWYVENWRHLPYWKDIACLYDCFFHIQPGLFEEKLAEIGCKDHAFIQTACDPALHRPVALDAEEKSLYDCDVSFAGAGYYNRIHFFKGLLKHNFKIWGVNWPDRDLAQHLVEGEARFDSEKFMKIVAGSRINLNLHSSTSHEGVDPKCDAINPRVFEIAAAGGFQVCDPCIGLDQHFDFESELPIYRSMEELHQLIAHYLAHPEERIQVAEKARQRVLAEHTYAHRAQAMLDFIFERHGARILKRGVRIQRTVGEMLERVEKDSALAEWLKTLPPDLLFTHDTIQEHVRPGIESPLYAEEIFAYMGEVRSFAEALLKVPR